jgi:hypothetical protein
MTPNSSVFGPDSAMDIPEDIASEGSQERAEAVLKYLLGVDTARNLHDAGERNEFSKQVTARICHSMAGMRAGLKEATLVDVLDKKVSDSLDRVNGSKVTKLEQYEQLSAALNAIYEMFGYKVMGQLTKEAAVPFANAVENQPPGSVSKNITFTGTEPIVSSGTITAGSHTVRVDMTHPFWKTNSFDMAKLRTELDGKRLKEVGIAIGNSTSSATDNYVLTPGDITLITAGPWGVVKLGNKFGETGKEEAIGTNLVRWEVNIDLLVRQRYEVPTTPSKTLALGACDATELGLVLETNWKTLVPDLANAKPTAVNATDPHPTAGVNWNVYVAGEIFRKAGKPLGAKLAGDMVDLDKIQKEITEREQVFDRLKDGAKNEVGAAVAIAMISYDPSILTKVPSADTKTLQTEQKELTKKKVIYDSLDKLKANLPKWEYPYPLADHAELMAERGKLVSDLGHVGTPGSWTSTNTPAISGYPDPDIADKADKADAKRKINDAIKQIDKDVKQYRDIANLLVDVKQKAKAAGINGVVALDKFFTSATSLVIKYDDFEHDMIPADVAAAILSEMQTSKGLDDLDKIDDDIAKNKDKLETAKKGELKGDTLQYKIFTEYLKARGIDNPEAKANYIAGRSYLDPEMDKALDGMLNKRFADSEKDKNKNFNREVIFTVAKSAGIPVVDNEEGNWTSYWKEDPDWAKANYAQLMGAYYALRQMYDGKTEYFQLNKSPQVNRQMKTIAKLLATQYGMRMYNETFSELADDDMKKKVKNPKMVTYKLITELLNGEAPTTYKGEVDRILSDVNKNVNWKRRKLARGTKKVAGNLLWRDSGYSARSFAWSNDYVGLGGAVNAVNWTGKQGVEGLKWGWKKRLTVATLGTLAVASGGALAPALFAATYAAMGGDETSEKK